MIPERLEGRKRNYFLILSAVSISLLFIAVKLFGMQIFAGGFYKEASEQNGVRIVPISAPRGIISDTDGTVLVKNRPSYSIYLVPYEVDNLDSAVIRLGQVLGKSPDDIKEQIRLGWQGRFQPIRLKRDIEFETVCFIEEHSLEFPGITFQVEPTRLYPESNYGSHIWGYVGETTEGDLDREEFEDYNLGDVVGKEGLEKQYERYLRGRSGLRYLEVTAGGKILGELPGKDTIKPVRGSEMTLEIDWELQKIAEEKLDSAGSGAVVAIDPRDGGVRILASVPDFDANLFSGVVSKAVWESVSSDSLHPLFNRAVKGTYPPGSTMKPFTAAAGLENRVITLTTTFDPCGGAKKFGNRTFRCWRPAGHGRLGVVDAIIQSCDVYFYQLGVQVGLDRWSEIASGCRFGLSTGIDLPGEVKGLVPSSSYFDSRYGERGWTRYLVVNLAIGQGELLVTPLQMAVLFAALGNKGTIYRPRIVSRIISPEGDTMTVEPEIVGNLPITEQNLEILHRGLVGVVSGERGTAHAAAIAEIPVAGKTGTAQNPHGEDHAWFVCYAPAQEPEIAIAVLVENAGHGGSIAAPLARKILEKYFENRSLSMEESVPDSLGNE